MAGHPGRTQIKKTLVKQAVSKNISASSPSPIGSASEQNVAFYQATAADLPFLIELRSLTMRAHYLAEGLPWDDDEQLRRIRNQFELLRIIILNGSNIGMLKLDDTTSPWQLVQIQIHPAHQNHGIGKGVLRDVLTRAHSAGQDVELHVLKHNPARRLYDRLGFRIIDEKETAYLMRWPHTNEHMKQLIEPTKSTAGFPPREGEG